MAKGRQPVRRLRQSTVEMWSCGIVLHGKFESDYQSMAIRSTFWSGEDGAEWIGRKAGRTPAPNRIERFWSGCGPEALSRIVQVPQPRNQRTC